MVLRLGASAAKDGMSAPSVGVHRAKGPMLREVPEASVLHACHHHRRSFDGAPLNSLIFVELCAGGARLSASMASRNFKVTAVDQKSNRHKQCHPIVCIDLL